MIVLFGRPFQLPPGFEFLAGVYLEFLLTALIWIAIALFAYFILSYVLRWVTHRLPGEIDDIILHVIRRPLLVLLVAVGIENSLKVLGLPGVVVEWLDRLFATVLILIGAWLAWRVLKDIVIYYGEAAVQRTESRLDDILLPIVNLFGALLVVLVATLLILPIYGIDVTSVLLGAGVLGLVLGLALQDTLSNIFSGISLLADAPFRIGDLIVLPDGKICRVDKIGLRATQLYYLDEHSTIYIPNKNLTNDMIVNITKPSVDLRIVVEVGVAYDSDLSHAEAVLYNIAASHPNILLSNLDHKIALLEQRVQELRQHAESKPAHPAREHWLAAADAYRRARERFVREQELNRALATLQDALQQLASAIHGKEAGGLTSAELKELQASFVAPAQAQVEQVRTAMETWSQMPDPWAAPEEIESEQERWREQNAHLQAHWKNLYHALLKPRAEQEMRLDDMTSALAQWLREEYKLIPAAWKDPSVHFKAFGSSSVDLALTFYIDDVRLEHFKRQTRIVREIGTAIHERLKQEGIEIPFPQLDLYWKNQAANGVSESKPS